MKRFTFSLLLFLMIFSVAGQNALTVKISYVMNKSNPPSYTFSTDFKGEALKSIWYFGDEGTSEKLQPTYAFKYTKNYGVQVKIVDNANNVWYGKTEALFEGANIVTSPCKALFTWAIAPFMGPSEENSRKVAFSNISAGTIKACTWTFGDETRSTELNPIHTYAKYGEYKVCLIIETTDGCKSDYCMTVKLIDPNAPVILYGKGYVKDFSSISGCKWGIVIDNTTVLLPAEMAMPFEFKAGQKVELAYELLQNTATICQAGKPVKIHKIAEIPVIPECKALFTWASVPNPTAADVISNKVAFTNKSTGNLKECIWYFGDETKSTELNPVHEYAKPGEYKVCLVIYTAEGCKSEYCTTIKAGYVTQPVILSGKGYVKDISSIAGCKWALIMDNTILLPVQMAVNFEFKAGQNVEFAYELLASTVTACQSGKPVKIHKIVEIPVSSACKAYFSATNALWSDPAMMKKMAFANQSTGEIKNCKWSFGDGTTSTELRPVHEYPAFGEYKVCLYIETATGCTSEYCAVVKVSNGTEPVPCAFDLVIKPKDQPANTFLFYALSKQEIKTWKWSFGDGQLSDAQNPSHTYEKPGVYEVKCTITTSTGCTVTKSVRFTVQSPALPQCPGAFSLLLFNPSGTTAVCNGKAVVTLMDENIKPYKDVKYFWSHGATGDTVKNLCPNKQYVVQAVIADRCQKSASFSFLTAPVMKIEKASGTYIFSVISPEEDLIYRWEFGDGKVAYGASVENSFDKEGNYDVKLTAISGDNSSTSEQKVAVILGTTSLDDMAVRDIQIYPNPVRERVWIDFNKPVSGTVDIDVIDMKGRIALIRNLNLNGQHYVELDTQSLKDGIYFLRVNHNDQILTGLKFLKQK